MKTQGKQTAQTSVLHWRESQPVAMTPTEVTAVTALLAELLLSAASTVVTTHAKTRRAKEVADESH